MICKEGLVEKLISDVRRRAQFGINKIQEAIRIYDMFRNDHNGAEFDREASSDWR